MTVTQLRGVVPAWTLPDRIRKAREHAGLSQGELAERLSVTRQSVVNWERGHTRPLRLILRVLADETGVDPGWLADDPGGETAGGTVYEPPPGIPAGMSGQPEPGYAEVASPLDEFRKRLPLTPPQEVPRTAMSQGLRPNGARKVPSRDIGPGSALGTDYRAITSLVALLAVA